MIAGLDVIEPAKEHSMPDDDRHVNPSGLPDDEKKPQPVPDEHHEEGHEEPKE